MGALLTRAWNENRVLVHVEDVPKGVCKELLNKTEKINDLIKSQRAYHFSHAYNHDCIGSDESLIHKMAKEVLIEDGRIMLPPSSGKFPSGLVKLHHVEAEKWDEHYHIKPDIVGIMENGEPLLIEFYYSHKVGKKKQRLIIKNNLKCLEVDLAFQDFDKDSLCVFITNSTEDREWIVPEEIVQNTENEEISHSSSRNPVYGQASDLLKQIFAENTLCLHPYLEYQDHYSMFGSDALFDLKKLGYDFHKAHYNNRRFKCDILLSKTKADGKKSFIAISVKGRRRPEGFRHPQNWLIIDILPKRGSTLDDIKSRWVNAIIIKTSDMNVIYTGFNQWLSKEKSMLSFD